MRTDYIRLRGKCKELSEQACAEDTTLTLVRGHYFCPIWNVDDPHWWCVRMDGEVFDPSKDQFPSSGFGIYTPFDGIVTCEECGKDIDEKDAKFESRYAFCSTSCLLRCVGL